MAEQCRRLACEAYAWLEKRARASGEEFWTLRDGRPEWVQGLVYAAHDAGQMWPDDWRYAFVAESLSRLSEGTEEYMDADAGHLTGWLASHGWRPGYVDEAVAELGDGRWPEGGVLAALAWGQLAEKREVLAAVQAFLEGLDEGEQEEGS